MVVQTLTSQTGGGNVPMMIENYPADSRVKIDETGTCQTLTGRMETGGGNTPMMMERTYCSTTGNEEANAEINLFAKDGVASTLCAAMANKWGLEDQHVNAGCPNFVNHRMKVRRLTPLECERLQGFPDGWTDVPSAKHDYPFWESVYATYSRIFGKKSYTLNYIKKWLDKASDDSARYKAIGNSVAVPCVSFLMQRIAKILEEE